MRKLLHSLFGKLQLEKPQREELPLVELPLVEKPIGKSVVMKEADTLDIIQTEDSRRTSTADSATGDPSIDSIAPATAPSDTQSTQPPASGASSDSSTSADRSSPDQLKERIVEQLKTVFDPEIPVNIYEMGLIYDVDVDPDGATRIRMTLTTPMCPAAEELPPEVESKARLVEGVTSVQLDLVWEPPWTPEMMSEAARLDLGMM
jgi:FeS assembly SUF system protein